jgi:hypothetical protein
MPKSKVSIDEAELTEILSLKDEVQANVSSTEEIHAELSALKQVFVQLHSNQDKFASLLGGMEKSINNLGSQFTSMADALQSMQPFRPSSSIVPQVDPAAILTQQSPTARQHPTQQQTQETRAGVRINLSRDQQLQKQCEIPVHQRPPPINTGQAPRSAPPGFNCPNNRETGALSPVGFPHTPAFHYFQPPVVRRGWEGFVRTFEQEQRMQFMKAITKGPRIDFPCFDGTNLGGWIRQCEKYFQMAGAPDEYKVPLA